jgi:hypothetical protein
MFADSHVSPGGGLMKHLSLNLEPLEQRTLFSVPAAEVVELPPPPTDSPGPGGGGQDAAFDAFLKIARRSFERGSEFFIKEIKPGGPEGFLKAGEAAIDQGTRFFLKLFPQEPI